MIHVISKPVKRKKEKKILTAVCQRLKDKDLPYELYITREKGGGRTIARNITQKEGEHTIVVIGGDGSFNDVLNGLQRPECCSLALIPAGTGNDFAACVDIPHGEAALEYLLNGQAKYTDYLQFSNGMRSLNIAGLGIDVDILVRYEKGKSRAKGKYYRSLLSSLIHYRGCKISVTVNGETTKHNAMIAAVCNGKQLGGGILLCPPAIPDDGKMDLIIVDYPKRSKLLGALLKLNAGKVLTLPFVHHIVCEKATITPDPACTAQYDGELYPAEQLEAKIVHNRLKVFRA